MPWIAPVQSCSSCKSCLDFFQAKAPRSKLKIDKGRVARRNKQDDRPRRTVPHAMQEGNGTHHCANHTLCSQGRRQSGPIRHPRAEILLPGLRKNRSFSTPARGGQIAARKNIHAKNTKNRAARLARPGTAPPPMRRQRPFPMDDTRGHGARPRRTSAPPAIIHDSIVSMSAVDNQRAEMSARGM